jgi:hypothetical protein
MARKSKGRGSVGSPSQTEIVHRGYVWDREIRYLKHPVVMEARDMNLQVAAERVAELTAAKNSAPALRKREAAMNARRPSKQRDVLMKGAVERDRSEVRLIVTCADDYVAMRLYDQMLAGLRNGHMRFELTARKPKA